VPCLLVPAGIVTGVAAVIIMVNPGTEATVQVSAQITSLGSNLLTVLPGQLFTLGQTAAARRFTLADAEAIRRDISTVVAEAPLASQAVIASFGNAHCLAFSAAWGCALAPFPPARPHASTRYGL
jgi:putative ABC transport system permease protein